MNTILLLVVAFTIQANQPAQGYKRPVTVVFKNGRELKGLIDQASDRKSLWIRMERERIRLQVECFWSDIRTIRFSKSISLSPQELKSQLHRYRTKAARQTGPEPWLPMRRPQGAITFDQQVRSINVEVTLANWDRDEEPDGFQLTVIPRDGLGRAIDAAGQLRVKLIGRKVDTAVLPNPTIQLENWGVRIDPGANIVRLPFRRIRPEKDRTLSSLGKLEVDFSVSGQGTFSATLETRIRRFRYQQSPTDF